MGDIGNLPDNMLCFKPVEGRTCPNYLYGIQPLESCKEQAPAVRGIFVWDRILTLQILLNLSEKFFEPLGHSENARAVHSWRTQWKLPLPIEAHDLHEDAT